MPTLMEATALVPFREPRVERERSVGPTTFMELRSFIDNVIVPQEQEKRQFMASTFQGAVQHFSSRGAEQEDWDKIKEAAAEAYKQQAVEDDDDEEHWVSKGDSLLKRVVKWAVKKLAKWVVKTAVKALFRFVTWIVKDIIYRGLIGLVEWMVRPVLMEVLGFIGLNPELWPIIAVLGGAAVLGYAAWDLFFKDKKPSLNDLTDAERADLTESQRLTTLADQGQLIVAAAPIGAGAPDEAGAPIRSITQSGQWSIGQTSQRYESGRGGAGTISGGVGDLGGVSYGIYQFSSRTGGVQEFLAGTIYGKAFEGLTPGTDAFNAKWKELAKDPTFGQAQHDFIKGKYYDVQMRRLNQAGFDFSTRGPAVQDVIWSTAVQMRGLTLGVVQGALAGKEWQKWTDAQIVAAIQDYKYQNTSKLFSRSPTLWDSLQKRALSEKEALVQLALAQPGYPQGTSSTSDTQIAMQNGVTSPAPQKQSATQVASTGGSGGAVGMPAPNRGNTVIKGPRGVLIAVNA